MSGLSGGGNTADNFNLFILAYLKETSMCNGFYNERLAPLNRQHLIEIQAALPRQAKFAEEVFKVLIEHLNPQVNLLVAFVALKEQYDQGLRGIFGRFGRVLYAPLSIVAKTAEHEWTRFRPEPVEELHKSFLSFMMAKENRLALEGVMEGYGLTLSQRHCCGVIVGESSAVQAFESSDEAKLRNEMRSYAESMGMPVVVTEFDNIPAENSDLGDVEKAFYALYEWIFERISLQGRGAYVDPRQELLWNEIVLPQKPLVVV